MGLTERRRGDSVMDYITFPVLMNWVTMLRADVDGAIVLADDDEEGNKCCM